jgi:hypothetical protein
MKEIRVEFEPRAEFSVRLGVVRASSVMSAVPRFSSASAPMAVTATGVLRHGEGRKRAPGGAGQQGRLDVAIHGFPNPVIFQPSDAFIQRSMIFGDRNRFHSPVKRRSFPRVSRARPVAPLHRQANEA